MDRTPVDKALEAVKAKVEHDKAAADLAAAKAAEARQAQEYRESLYKMAISDLYRQATGKPPRPMPQDAEQFQQYVIHLERIDGKHR